MISFQIQFSLWDNVFLFLFDDTLFQDTVVLKEIVSTIEEDAFCVGVLNGH